MSATFKVILLLVLANVVVFLWPSKANLAPHVYTKKAELNPHFVRLNKEIEDPFYAKVGDEQGVEIKSNLVQPEIEIIDIETSANAVETSTADFDSILAESPVSQSSGGQCYRLGPFMHQASYELAQAVLFNANVDFQTSVRSSQESKVFRLFLGPFADAKEVAAARLELKQKRVLDHFSRKLDDGKYMISLGIYSTQKSANSAFRLFADKVADVKVQNEMVVLPDNYWLHFKLLRASSKFAQLSNIDWGETSVKLGPHSCGTV